ncbi:28S ribosomal protein S27, mitochondrial [Nymphon striatum]|nr:28S ribosomal protein S27, mitochondrial [Nymphon striatum]
MTTTLGVNRLNIISLIHKLNGISKINFRTILSDAYLSNDAWKSRLSTQPLAKIKMGNLFQFQFICFANNITKEDQLYELEDLIHRFRRTPQTISILPSTFHATIRSFLQYKDSKSLLRILQDKHNYGIFPDKFCYNILMDYFIKENNFKDAVKIVKLMMLQEDVGDDISISLAFYSCYKLIQESMPSPYVKEEEQVEEEVDEDDIDWVRVHFLREDYFDDHFDIKDGTLLLGKSMWVFGQTRSNTLGFTFQFIGLCLYQKWEKLLRLMDTVLENQNSITKDGMEKFQKHLSEIPEIEESVKSEINDKLKKMSSSGLIIDTSMEELINNQLTEINEATSIEEQIQIYKNWNEARKKELQRQLDNFIRVERIKKISAKRKELKETEELLFFFENFQKIKKDLDNVKSETNSDKIS